MSRVVRVPGRRVAPLMAVLALGVCSSEVHADFDNNIYTRGHADIGVAYEDDGLHLHYHFGSNAWINGAPLGVEAEMDPSEVTTIVIGPSVGRPAGAQWDFLGNAAGEPIWFLPQQNNPTKPFLGFATEELNATDWVNGTMTWEMLGVVYTPGVDNPGDSGLFSVWQTDFGGNPTVRWSEAAGVTSFTTPAGSNYHDHFNFGFTALGVYDVTIRASGTHVLDGFVSDTAVYRFNVGPVVAVPEPGSLALAVVGLGGGLVACRRRGMSYA